MNKKIRWVSSTAVVVCMAAVLLAGLILFIANGDKKLRDAYKGPGKPVVRGSVLDEPSFYIIVERDEHGTPFRCNITNQIEVGENGNWVSYAPLSSSDSEVVVRHISTSVVIARAPRGKDPFFAASALGLTPEECIKIRDRRFDSESGQYR